MVESSANKEVKAKVAVVGSLNQDKFLIIQRPPKVGETIASTGIVNAYGGKGAN